MIPKASLWDESLSILSAGFSGARYGVKIRLPHALIMTFLFRKDLATSQKLKCVLQLVKEHASSLAMFAGTYKAILAILKWLSRIEADRAVLKEDTHNIWRSIGRRMLRIILDGAFCVSDSRTEQIGVLPPSPTQPGYPERAHHALLAGAVGGYFVWGRNSSVCHQVVLYLTSRVLVGVWKLAIRHFDSTHPRRETSITAKATSSATATTITKSSSDKLYPFAAALVWGLVMLLFEESPDVLHPSLRSSMEEIYHTLYLPGEGEL